MSETQTHDAVVQVWAELLGRTPGGADDFFAMGGHSLLAARATARLRRALGIPLEMSELFDHPVLAAYVDHVDHARKRAR